MLLYLSDQYTEHRTGKHPECVDRIVRVNSALRGEAGGPNWTQNCECPNWQPAKPDILARVHNADYVQQLEQWCSEEKGQIESDTYVSAGTWAAALLGAGAGIDAVQRVVTGTSQTAFCAMRPPGHHALPTGPMGFCVLNNIAIAAREALKLGLERVLVVDWDVHHGNGTQDAFYEDGQVGFFSIHRSPFYPGTGAESETGTGKGLGFTMNRPVTAGILKQQFFDSLQIGLEAFAARVKPQLILLSAGFDAHREDPVGGLCLESEDFGRLTQIVCDVAQSMCDGRLVSLLEGGYNLDRLPESVLAHVETLHQFENQV